MRKGNGRSLTAGSKLRPIVALSPQKLDEIKPALSKLGLIR